MEYIRLSGIAAELGVDKATVRRFVENKTQIKPLRTQGGLILFTSEDAEQIIAAMTPKVNPIEKQQEKEK